MEQSSISTLIMRSYTFIHYFIQMFLSDDLTFILNVSSAALRC